MSHLPQHPDIEHLKKQAKDLLRQVQSGDSPALARIRASLPAAAGKETGEIAAMDLRLHDARSCLAREYGFPSWNTLSNYVELRNNRIFDSRSTGIPVWLNIVYGHDGNRSQPALAVRLLQEHPDFGQGDLLLACAIGDQHTIRRTIAADSTSVNRVSSTFRCPCCNRPHAMAPLAAVTHSSLLQIAEFRDRLHHSARLLLAAGADVNQPVESEHGPLSPLYGAAGKNHDAELTKMLLAGGAKPNDGESLYHSVESSDSACMTLLLEAGAIVEGSNALHHALDYDRIDQFRQLLAATKDANDVISPLGPPLLWAIRRHRSRAHIQALLSSGANPQVRDREGTSAYVLAIHYGLVDAAALLRSAGAEERVSPQDEFLSACTRHDEADARRILQERPRIFEELTPQQLRLLPEIAAVRNVEAVRLMVTLGWPIAVRGGDWEATALNVAVFQGDAELTRFLLEHGASWEEQHGHGDNVHGTLAWASRNHDPEEGDWVGCAHALIDHGLPVSELSGEYSDEVATVIANERARLQARV